MSFLAPAALAFALAIPAIVLFYLLKRRRVTVRVPSTLFWERYLAEAQANAPFQRLRANWLLLLQILLLLFAVLAIMRPFIPGQESSSSLRILILDASASMQSTDVPPSRFEVARQEARRWIDSLKPGQSMLILQAGPRIEVRRSPTSDKNSLRQALAECQPSDGTVRMEDALTLAESLSREVADAEIHLFSDGAFGSLEGFQHPRLPLVFHKVGLRRNNVAFASLEVRAPPDNPSERAVFASLANLSPEAVRTTVELLFENQVVDLQTIEIPPGESEAVTFVVRQSRDGVFTVRHNAPDDLPADNQASVASLLPQPLRVVLVTRGNRFLERALRTAGQVDLTVAPSIPIGEPLDIVVLDGVEPSSWPDVNLLAAGVAHPDWFTGLQPQNSPAILDWNTRHPLMRFVSLNEITLADAQSVPSPTWGTVLAETAGGPVMVAGERGRQRIVWLGFDLLNSTWPLRVSFPIFVANAMTWLDPSAAHAERLNLTAGDALRVDVPPGIERVEIRPPNGSWQSVPVSASGTALFAGTDRQGIYQARWGTNQIAYAVQALDLRESNNAPREELEVGRFRGTTAASLRTSHLELWRWIALAALAVLLFEWWYFHRRTA